MPTYISNPEFCTKLGTQSYSHPAYVADSLGDMYMFAKYATSIQSIWTNLELKRENIPWKLQLMIVKICRNLHILKLGDTNTCGWFFLGGTISLSTGEQNLANVVAVALPTLRGTPLCNRLCMSIHQTLQESLLTRTVHNTNSAAQGGGGSFKDRKR